MGSLEDHFQHLNILCLPKLYSFSVGKFMHSYHNKLLPNHFDEYFIPLSSIHYHSTRLATSDVVETVTSETEPWLKFRDETETETLS